MVTRSSIVGQLCDLPPAERRSALDSMVTAQFRAVLMMAEDEPLPLTESLFSLGMSSVLITEVQQQLSILTGRDLSADVLFNSCTIERVVDYLITDPLAGLFADRPEHRAIPGPRARPRALWDAVLRTVALGRT